MKERRVYSMSSDPELSIPQTSADLVNKRIHRSWKILTNDGVYEVRGHVDSNIVVARRWCMKSQEFKYRLFERIWEQDQ